ncbi:hypothetical protein GCM10028793_14140 [Nocardiopsis oceani]
MSVAYNSSPAAPYSPHLLEPSASSTQPFPSPSCIKLLQPERLLASDDQGSGHPPACGQPKNEWDIPANLLNLWPV